MVGDFGPGGRRQAGEKVVTETIKFNDLNFCFGVSRMRIVQKKYFAGILAAALALAGCSTTPTGAANAKGIHAVATTTQICDYLTQIANNGMKLVKTDSAGHETTSGDGDVTFKPHLFARPQRVCARARNDPATDEGAGTSRSALCQRCRPRTLSRLGGEILRL